MRTLCPNLDREDALQTVLEVPVPEETFSTFPDKNHTNISTTTAWHNIKSWMEPQTERSSPPSSFSSQNTNIQLLLGVVGAPLIPLPVHSDHTVISRNIKDHPIEAAMSKYIVQQYIAATGGQKAINSIDSMCIIGKVKMKTSDFITGDTLGLSQDDNNKMMRSKSVRNGEEMGGFVFWQQKRTELWCLELVVSGYKISAGSDGKVSWRQTPWNHSHASRGPPRPLRRSFQGLDPRSTANLFSDSICVGEKTINNEDCFVLKVQAEPTILRARSSKNVEIIQHTVWGYFSQRTGLLIKLDDSHLLKIKAKVQENDNVLWETTMESLVQDYRTIDGVNIAHSGQTSVSLFRFGENSESHSKTRMDEVWRIEEVNFNIKGLSMDCFLAPADLKEE
ncbi:uncharacterized protein LOC141724450 [Apium graveolens]|uniref:uncharacterized protein LOC141724450 n=1 Tax=Apium graveolens TaxID=4045 RepID=UPI003D78F345